MHGHPPFDLYEAIYTTRSMRRLKPDPVPPELIVKVIEAATMGPPRERSGLRARYRVRKHRDTLDLETR